MATILPGAKAPGYGWGCCFVFWHLNIELPRWVAVWVFIIGVETAGCVIALTGISWVRSTGVHARDNGALTTPKNMRAFTPETSIMVQFVFYFRDGIVLSDCIDRIQ